jgi:hypothetical protein
LPLDVLGGNETPNLSPDQLTQLMAMRNQSAMGVSAQGNEGDLSNVSLTDMGGDLKGGSPNSTLPPILPDSAGSGDVPPQPTRKDLSSRRASFRCGMRNAPTSQHYGIAPIHMRMCPRSMISTRSMNGDCRY